MRNSPITVSWLKRGWGQLGIRRQWYPARTMPASPHPFARRMPPPFAPPCRGCGMPWSSAYRNRGSAATFELFGHRTRRSESEDPFGVGGDMRGLRVPPPASRTRASKRMGVPRSGAARRLVRYAKTARTAQAAARHPAFPPPAPPTSDCGARRARAPQSLVGGVSSLGGCAASALRRRKYSGRVCGKQVPSTLFLNHLSLRCAG